MLLVLLWSAVFSQNQWNTGRLFVSNYTPRQYNGHPQNWAVEQDDDGVIYIANNQSLMQFDGVTWSSMNLPFRTVIRSLAKGADGKIYIGANQEFGYVLPDSTGTFVYTSLSNRLHIKNPDYSEVRRILCMDTKTYFVAYDQVFCFENDTILSWSTNTSFRYGFSFQNDVFLWHEGNGLSKIVDDKLVLVEGTEILKDKVVHFMLPYGDNKILAGTRYNGLFLLEKNDNGFLVSPFRTNFSEYLLNNYLYHGIKLSSGNYAIATDFGGVVIMDQNGNLIQVINKKTGLQNETINYVFEDRDNNLWIALNIGVANVNVNSPITFFGEESSLNGLVLSAARHKGLIYAGTMQGVFYLKETQKLNEQRDPNFMFHKVENIQNSCMHLIPYHDMLLAALPNGIYSVEEQEVHMIDSIDVALSLHHYNKWPGYLFVSTSKGINLYKEKADSFEKLGEIEGISGETRKLEEDEYGNLWVAGNIKGLIAISFGGNEPVLNPEIHQLDSTCGLPLFNGITIAILHGKLRAVTDSGIYSCAPRQRIEDIHFEKDYELPRYYEPGQAISYTDFVEDDSVVWVNASTRIFRLSKQDTMFSIWDIPFRKIRRTTHFTIYDDKKWDKLWFGGTDGLYCFNKTQPIVLKDSIKMLIRKISFGKDSVVFAGNDQRLIHHYDVIHDANHLEVNFAMPFFDGEKRNVYRYKLENFDLDWSGWDLETKAVYTNIPPGDYTFMVSGKNIYGKESSTVSFSFTITPPWYRTPLAYFLFSILFITLIIIGVRLYVSQLKRKNAKLEMAVKERTIEITMQTEELQLRHEQLEIINMELEKLSIVARETTNAVMIMDTNGYFEWINEGFTRLYGYTLNQLITEKCMNIREYSANEDIQEIFERCINEKTPVIYESVILTRDEGKRWAQTTLTPIIDEHGNVIKVVAIDSDIDKVKQAEEEIKHQKEEIQSQRDQLEEINKELEKLSIVARETENTVVIMDAEGNFEWINESLSRIYGYTLEGFIAKKGRNIRKSSSNPNINNILDRCISEKKSIVYDSLTHTDSNKTMWSQTTLTPILDENGNIYKIVAIDSDITKVKKAELEITRQKEKIQAQSDLLAQTNQELERNNRLVTDSIHYAKKIQEAVLPMKEAIDEILHKNFILYKPRDIVSGDFYWFHAESKKIVVAVSDCTGHGVPGALMAMIGNTFLNEIVKEKKIYTPATILERLNSRVIALLRQKDNLLGQDDGMDISICTIDLDKKQLQIASANQSMLIIQDSIPTRIEPDIHSVGGTFAKSQEAVSFRNFKFSLNKHTSVYMYTDGYRDQFGGPNGEKFMAVNFERILIDNHFLDMKRQHEILEEAFIKWKKDGRQIDDVLVLGFTLEPR